MNALPQTMAQIARIVAERRGVSLEDLMSSNRRHIARFRQEAMWEMRQRECWSLSQIGRFFQGLDHSTISQGVRAHEVRTFGALLRHRRLDGEPLQRPARIAKDRSSRIELIRGSQDGIRFGVMYVEGLKRGFFHDRLNGVVRIYCQAEQGDRRMEDRKPSRLALAHAVLDAQWASERSAAG